MPIAATLASVLLIGACAKVGHGVFGLAMSAAAYLVYAATQLVGSIGASTLLAPVQSSRRSMARYLERRRSLVAIEAGVETP